MANRNKIVRIHNKQISAQIERVARETGAPYQYVFDRACELWLEGYMLGVDFHQTLFDYTVQQIKDDGNL